MPLPNGKVYAHPLANVRISRVMPSSDECALSMLTAEGQAAPFCWQSRLSFKSKAGHNSYDRHAQLRRNPRLTRSKWKSTKADGLDAFVREEEAHRIQRGQVPVKCPKYSYF